MAPNFTTLATKKRTNLGQGLFNIKSNIGAILKRTPAEQGSLAGAVQIGVAKAKKFYKEEVPLQVITSGKIFKKGGLKKFAERLPSAEELARREVEQGPSFGAGGFLKKAKPILKEVVGEGFEKLAKEVRKFKSADDFIESVRRVAIAKKPYKADQYLKDTANLPKNDLAEETVNILNKIDTSSRGWFDKAKDFFKTVNPIAGELVTEDKNILNLRNITPELNTRHFKVSEDAKKLINADIDELREMIQEKVGPTLSHQEVKNFANQTSKLFKTAIDRETTKRWEGALYNLRTTIAEQAESGKATQEFINNVANLKTISSDTARRLNSFAMEAGPKSNSQMQAMIGAIQDMGVASDEVLKAAKGVNFNNFDEASAFYRSFIKPKLNDWIDLVRYNSMLSSPSTHIVNISSNILGSSLVRALTKTVAGGVDFIGSKISGKARKNFSGEGWAYLKSYLSAGSRAYKEALEVMRGKKSFVLPDIRRIPPAVRGFKGVIAKTLSFPLRALETADRFFSILGEAGETGALRLKVKRGIKLSEEAIQLKAQKGAVYSVFRSGLHEAEQGAVLDALDYVTGLVMRARNANNPIISTIGKWTLPFVQTPANILKQGIEYSPLGFTTIGGAANKTEQIAKALIGSTVFGMTYLAYASGRITGAEPTNKTERDVWRAAHKQPWSIEVKGKSIQYNRMHPALAFPMAMVAIIEDLKKDRKTGDDFVNIVLKGVSKYGNFLSDQAYFKSIGDLFNAIKGDEFSLSKLVSNYPQQIIPFRAMGGWFARLFDEYERQPDYGAPFIDKQLQLLMMNIPGVSQLLPARKYKGEAVKANLRVENAFLPFRVKEMNQEILKFLEDKEQFNKAKSEAEENFDKLKQKVRPIYDEIQSLLAQNLEDQAAELRDSLTEEEYQAYKSISTSEKTRKTNEEKIRLYPTYLELKKLKEEGRSTELQQLLESLTDEEYDIVIKIRDSQIGQFSNPQTDTSIQGE